MKTALWAILIVYSVAHFIAATGWFVYRWRRGRVLEVECALLAIVMCLVSPHANMYYFIFALPALSIGIVTVERNPERVTPRRALRWQPRSSCRASWCRRRPSSSWSTAGRAGRPRAASVVIAGVWSHPGGRAHGGAA